MLPSEVGSPTQLPSKRKLRLTVTVRATDSFRGKLVSNLLFDLLKENGFESVVLIRADRGYDQRGFATSSVLGLSMKVPVILDAVEEGPNVLPLLPRIKEIVGSRGQITLSEVDVY